MQETLIQYLCQEDPLEKGMATHSSILPGEFQGQRSLAGYSLWAQRVGHDWETNISLHFTSPFPAGFTHLFFTSASPFLPCKYNHQCYFSRFHTTTTTKSLQLCPTLCDPIDGSPPGSPIPGILQARTLEWVAISFSNAWKWKMKVKSLSRVRLLATSWTAAHQAPPLSMGFPRQEYWSEVPLPSPLEASTAYKGRERRCWQNLLALRMGVGIEETLREDPED